MYLPYSRNDVEVRVKNRSCKRYFTRRVARAGRKRKKRLGKLIPKVNKLG